MRYLIKKGKHNRLSMPCVHFGITKLKFKFKLDSSCLYPIIDADDFDLNKLYGFSYGMHHKNSIRIGWRPDNFGKIQIHTYNYNNGNRTMNYMYSIDTDKWYNIEIEVLLCSKVVFALSNENGAIIKVTENFVPPDFKWGYFLDFFMGGNKPARQNTIAWIERLN